MIQLSASKKFVLAAFGSGIKTLGLALIVGGMLALGAFTAPTVFKSFPRPEAASAMALIFGRYDRVVLVALALVLTGEACRFVGLKGTPGSNSWQKRDALHYGLMALLTASLLYSTLGLNPEIARMNRAGVHRDKTTQAGQAFEKLHRRSETFYKWELLGAALLILLAPFTERRQGISGNTDGLAELSKPGFSKNDA